MRNFFAVYGNWAGFRQFTEHHVYGTSFVTSRPTDNFEKTLRIFTEFFFTVYSVRADE